ncbi:DUF3383 domain-containing protein (plasmid) [Candidatus Trichorickettsia mobilis]|uniref:DUF3383 domain-containing protein n=1 Tax=Candidatus Trichorickettsia mobilis TaxID=1346319 RepID=A0ABZ0UU24_9RICK|nr:DUF3383 family protein [Candidatus Trichorickettsia mobilis]WPY01534.1 DUF3383 domain-containing protein [Candidatus Trichorickettsia mobilis]
MSLIDEIVSVQITQADLGVNTASFDKLLIIGNSNKDKNIRLKYYGSINEVSVDFKVETPEYKAANLAFSQIVKPTQIMIGQILAGEKYIDAYNAIKLQDNSFYGVVITTRISSEILSIAEAVEADIKIFGCSSNDENIIKTGDQTSLAYKLYAKKYNRTFCIYSAKANSEVPEAAILGLMLTYNAGSANWAHRQIKGTTGDSLDTTARAALDAVNCNSILQFAGRNVHFWGKSVGGQWLDIVHGTDWLKSAIQDRVASVLQSALKVEYTDTGVTMITTALKACLFEAADNNFLDKDTIKVTAPRVLEVPSSKKAARTLPDVYFEAVTSGAINKVQIQGVLSI